MDYVDSAILVIIGVIILGIIHFAFKYTYFIITAILFFSAIIFMILLVKEIGDFLEKYKIQNCGRIMKCFTFVNYFIHYVKYY